MGQIAERGTQLVDEGRLDETLIDGSGIGIDHLIESGERDR